MGGGKLLPVAFVVVVAVALFVATTSTAARTELDPQLRIQGGDDDSWPCCNRCGICTKSFPPKCKCDDLVLKCHSSCQKCVRSLVQIYPERYQCKDLIVNYCERPCPPEPDTLRVE